MREMSLWNKAIQYKSTKIKEKIRGVFWDVIDQGWCQGKTVGGGLTAWVISQTVPPPRPIVFLNHDDDPWRAARFWNKIPRQLLGFILYMHGYSEIHGSI